MPQVFESGIWTREEWQEERDKKGAPAGAAKVGIGPALDKFHAANRKGLSAGVQALPVLEAALGDYLKAIKAKYPKWHARVESYLLDVIDNYKDTVGKMVKAGRTYNDHYADTHKALQEAHLEWVRRGRPEKFKPANVRQAKQELDDFLAVLRVMPYLTDKVRPAAVKGFAKGHMRVDSSGNWGDGVLPGLIEAMKLFPARLG